MGTLSEAQKRSINERAKVVSTELSNTTKHITQLLEVLPAHHARSIVPLPILLQGIADRIQLIADAVIELDGETDIDAINASTKSSIS